LPPPPRNRRKSLRRKGLCKMNGRWLCFRLSTAFKLSALAADKRHCLLHAVPTIREERNHTLYGAELTTLPYRHSPGLVACSARAWVVLWRFLVKARYTCRFFFIVVNGLTALLAPLTPTLYSPAFRLCRRDWICRYATLTPRYLIYADPYRTRT